MVASNSLICLSKISKPKKATHRINLVKQNDVWVGAEPLNANSITRFGIEMGWLGFKADKIKSEVQYKDSRIDFFVKENNFDHLIEVKSVILKENNTAYFPDGYVKKKGKPVSERALHHVENLISFAREKN